MFPAKWIRDIIVANHSSMPFWQMLRQQYGATQTICECKNYKDLTSDDFHQVSYYRMTDWKSCALDASWQLRT
jgi:hypothetical protein